MRLLKLFTIIFAILSLGAIAAEAKSLDEIEAEIKAAKSRLEKSQSDEGALQSKVDALSKEIAAANALVAEIEKALANGEKEIKKLAQKAAGERDEFGALQKQKESLAAEKDAIEKRLVKLLAKHAAQSLVIGKSGSQNEADIIKTEIFFLMRDRVEKDAARLKSNYADKMAQIKKTQSRIDELQGNLDALAKADGRQRALRSEQTKLIDALNTRKSGYLTELNKLIDQKNRERQLLADLNIMRQKTADDMKQSQIAKQDALPGAKIAIKQYGVSYQSAGAGSYDGKKVKAPLDSPPITVTKAFGPYTDPVYNIKIHNDSVTLKPSSADALVRSVLPGKVVFADNIKTLGKVVIVEHQGNIHTIYRNLESISPNIKVARSLKERESIGRVSGELVFEVTKDGLPINPLQLISI
ncbi:MAG: peptidoglycan DD-metalloendopeptidase family protein [Helicobacteraceae bacterium]|jgi:septal ring factor EnvC (AmiA/AmiB activator)|nr:peptidoglycan DD-metalloendopeptidase family protein [Helicobacteraceae bacterium]